MSCPQVFSDTNHGHPDLLVISSSFPVLTFTFHGDDVPAQAALVTLSKAHVLLAGTSAFSRIAAVLSRGVVIAPSGMPTRPLADLRAVLTIYDRRFWDRSR